MADRLYKIGEEIDLGYQAPNKETGATIIAEIFLPNKQKDSNFPDVTLVEVGTTGTYRGVFTPDAQGTWQVVMHKQDGEGQVTKSYSVGAKNIQDIYTDTAKDSTVAKSGALGVVDGKVDNVQTTVNAIDSQLDTVEEKVDDVNANVDAAETSIRGTDNDTLKTLSDQLDGVDNKVSALDTPPMAF